MRTFFETQVSYFFKRFSVRNAIVIFVILIAILSRLIGLGDRVMSHDEVNHVVPAFDLFAGRGYRHDPVTHGPLQFHLMGLSYFLFGDNDFTSRLPHATFSILTIIFIIVYFRRYLGNIGSITAGILFTISPFMLFYGRYARNDVICVFLGVVAIYTFLRFFETRDKKFLYFLTAALALNFTAKETAYIFSAQLLIFVLVLFLQSIFTVKINNKKKSINILILNILLILVILLSLTISILLFRRSYAGIQGVSTPAFEPSGLKTSLSGFFNSALPILRFLLPGLLPLLFLIAVLVYLKKLIHWDTLSNSPAFSVLILIGTLVLPLLAPFLVRFARMDPSAYSDTYVVVTDYVFITILFMIAYIVGSAWDQENWWKLAFVFYGIYAVLYSTFFTNPVGLMTGMVGSLGHWLNQQSVQRGGQPAYYYAFFLLPIYEFLSLFGTLLAFYFGITLRKFWRKVGAVQLELADSEIASNFQNEPDEPDPPFFLPIQNLIPDPSINIFLVITSIVAYTIAGEKMPWLALHIVFPMILTAAWAFDIVLMKFKISDIHKKWIVFAVYLGLFFNTILIVLQLLGSTPPFQSQTTRDLQATYRFLFLCIIEAGLFSAAF